RPCARRAKSRGGPVRSGPARSHQSRAGLGSFGSTTQLRRVTRTGADEENAGLHRAPRKQQYYRALGCPCPKNAADCQKNEAAPGSASKKNEMVRLALANLLNGAARRNEHRGVRRFLFQRLHAGLRKAPARNES